MEAAIIRITTRRDESIWQRRRIFTFSLNFPVSLSEIGIMGHDMGGKSPKFTFEIILQCSTTTIFALVLKMQKDGRDPDSGFPESSGFLS